MATLEKAIELAAKYHAAQTDKGGAPYILHPLAVMAQVDGITAKIVAVLHDIIEDTPLSAQDLRNEGFSQEIIEAILALSKQPGETRRQAAERTVKNPLARVVKIADITENMKIERITNPSAEDYQRLAEYRQVLQFLQAD